MERRSPVAGEPMSSDVARAKSGLYVKAANGLRLRDRKTERLARKVRDTLPWVTEADWPAIRAWSEMQILADQAYAILRYATVTNKEGEPRKLLNDYRMLRMSQATIAASLGMTPASRMAIKATSRDVPLDLVAQLAQANEMENATEVETESSNDDGATNSSTELTSARRPPRPGKWNVRMPDGRYRPKEKVSLNSGEPIAPDDDLVSAMANTPSSIDESAATLLPQEVTVTLPQEVKSNADEPATDAAGTVIIDDESLF